MKEKITPIRQAIEAALTAAGLEDKFDVTFETGSARYTDNNFTLKLEITNRNVDGTAVTKAMADFNAHAWTFGLKPEHLGAEFGEHTGKRWRIVGLKPRSYKYPILCEALDGQKGTSKFPAQRVESGLRRAGLIT